MEIYCYPTTAANQQPPASQSGVNAKYKKITLKLVGQVRLAHIYIYPQRPGREMIESINIGSLNT
jgi:hypothetical protein